MSTPRLVRFSAITTGAALVLGLSAPASAADNSLEITVTGLPAKAELTKAPKIFLMGPWGKKDTSTRRLGRHTTITGLRAGTYRLTAAPAITRSGSVLSPEFSIRSVKVRRRSAKQVAVLYSAGAPGTEYTSRIDMNEACRFQFGDSATAHYRSASDASSWYCQLPDGRTSGMDLDSFCHHKVLGRAAYYGQGISDWRCVWHGHNS